MLFLRRRLHAFGFGALRNGVHDAHNAQQMLLEAYTRSGEAIGVGMDRLIIDFEFSRQLSVPDVKRRGPIDLANVAGSHRNLPNQNVA